MYSNNNKKICANYSDVVVAAGENFDLENDVTISNCVTKDAWIWTRSNRQKSESESDDRRETIQCRMQTIISAPICFEKCIYLVSFDSRAHGTIIDQNFMREYQIKIVLTIGERPLPRLPNLDHIEYIFIRARDEPTMNMLQYFDPIYRLLAKCAETRRSILLHCDSSQRTFSLSGCAVCAYFMRQHRCRAEDAIQFFRRRSFVSTNIGPNIGFLNQLFIYERSNYCVDRYRADYRYFMFTNLIDRIRRKSPEAGSYSPISTRSPFQDRRHKAALIEYFDSVQLNFDYERFFENNFAYNCAKCRRMLFTEINLLRGPDWERDAATDGSLKTTELNYCDAFILEPLRWMFFDAKTLRNESIYCPRCDAQLGYYRVSGVACKKSHHPTGYCVRHPTADYNIFHIFSRQICADNYLQTISRCKPIRDSNDCDQKEEEVEKERNRNASKPAPLIRSDYLSLIGNLLNDCENRKRGRPRPSRCHQYQWKDYTYFEKTNQIIRLENSLESRRTEWRKREIENCVRSLWRLSGGGDPKNDFDANHEPESVKMTKNKEEEEEEEQQQAEEAERRRRQMAKLKREKRRLEAAKRLLRMKRLGIKRRTRRKRRNKCNDQEKVIRKNES